MKATQENELILDLYKHDVAACDIYKEVLLHITDPDIHKKITDFLHDHERHVQDLEAAYHKHVGEPPARGIDIKGTILFGYASIRSITGQEGALKALQSAEEVVLKRYQDAKKHKDWSEDMAQIVDKDLRDEQRHSEFLDGYLGK